MSVAVGPADAESRAVSDCECVAAPEREAADEVDGCSVGEVVIVSEAGAENVEVSTAVLDIVGTFDAAVKVPFEDSVKVASAVIVSDVDEVDVGDDELDADSEIFEEDVEEEVTEALPLCDGDAEFVAVAEFVDVALLESVT